MVQSAISGTDFIAEVAASEPWAISESDLGDSVEHLMESLSKFAVFPPAPEAIKIVETLIDVLSGLDILVFTKALYLLESRSQSEDVPAGWGCVAYSVAQDLRVSSKDEQIIASATSFSKRFELLAKHESTQIMFSYSIEG